MKAKYLLFLFSFFQTTLHAQILFEENFDNGIPNTFNLIDVDGATANQNVAQYQGSFSAAMLSGQDCAVSTSWLNPVGVTDDWMVTPAITMTNGTIFLTFSAIALDPDYSDGVEVYVSTTGQDVADFGGQALYNSTSTGEADQWTLRSIDLSNYSGQTIYIAFRNNSDDDYILGIDDIKVKVLGENDAQLSNATIDSPLEGNRTLEVEVTNGGSNSITSFDVEWTFDGSSYTENVTNQNLATGQSTNVQLSLGDLVEGSYNFSAEVTNVNAGTDPDMSDNSLLYQTINITVPVPDFSLTDSDGNAWNLYDQLASGKMVVLDFFASWSGPCQFSTPELNTLYIENYDNVDVFGITIEQTDNDAVVNGLGWGATYPKFSFSNDGYAQYDHYARVMGNNTQGSIPFFIMICPNPDNLAYSEVVASEVGFTSGMFNTSFLPLIQDCTTGPTSISAVFPSEPAICYGDQECAAINFSGLDNSLSYDLVIERDHGGFLTVEDLVVDFSNDPNFNIGYSSLNYCFPVQGNYMLTLALDGAEIDNIAYQTQEYPTDLTINVLDPNPSVICTGDENGSFSVFLSGGNTSLSYTCSGPNGFFVSGNSGGGVSFNDLVAGLYTVTLSNHHGCTKTATVNVNDPGEILFFPTKTDESCFNFNDGVISMDNTLTTGGNGSYTYTILEASNTNIPISTQLITQNLTPGDYVVQVTDQDGCENSNAVVINAATEITSTILDFEPNCPGGTGSATITADGGTAPYQYSWNGGALSPNNTNINLSAGSVTYSIVDAKNCVKTNTFELTEPEALTATIVATNDVVCFGDNNGEIGIEFDGGTPNYSISFFQAGNNIGDFSAADNMINYYTGFNQANNYSFAMSDANGCVGPTTPFVIGGPTDIVLSGQLIEDVDCFGESTGSISVLLNGGSGDYTYTWTDISGVILGTSENSVNGLAAGLYNLNVNDGNCTKDFQFTVDEETEIEIFENIIYDASSIENCDAVVITTHTGGSPPYTYSWNGIETDYVTTLCPGYNYQTIINSQGCVFSDTVFVGPTALGCTDIFACNYNYLANSDDGSCTYPTNIYDCFNNCINDIDQDGVCDELEIFGCTNATSPNFNENATEDDGSCIECNFVLDYITYNTSTNEECDGLIALLTGNQEVTSILVNDISVSSIYYQSACYGPNYIVVEFEDGCVYNDVVNVGATIYADDCPQVTGLYTDNYTFDSYYASVEGYWDSMLGTGVTDFLIKYKHVDSLQWNNLSNLDSTSTSRIIGPLDYNTTYVWSVVAYCSEGSFQDPAEWAVIDTFTTLPYEECPSPTNLYVDDFLILQNNAFAQGTWDSMSGTGVDHFVLNYKLLSDTEWMSLSNMDSTVTSCYMPDLLQYNFYEWRVQAYCSVNQSYFSQWSETDTFYVDGFMPIVYGCTDSTAINYNSLANTDNDSCEYCDQLQTETTSTIESCLGYDATATVSVTGGVGGYSYFWTSDNNNSLPLLLQDGSVNPSVNNPTAQNVSNGWVYVFVQDVYSCYTTDSVFVSQSSSPQLQLVGTVDNLCYGDENGQLSLTVSGGTPLYEYSINSGVSWQSNSTFNGLGEGLYNIIVRDSFGCVDELENIEITSPQPFGVNISTSNASCNGLSDGMASVTSVYGGTLSSDGYSFTWFNLITNEIVGTDSILTAPAGSYYLTVQDDLGCPTYYSPVIIGEPLEVSVDLAVISDYNGLDIRCFGDSNAVIQANASGGTGLFTFEWFDSDGIILDESVLSSYTFDTLSNISQGTYSIVVTDSLGCPATNSISVTHPPQIVVDFENVVNIRCEGNNDGQATALYSGGLGFGNYNVVWTDSTNTVISLIAQATQLSVGSYVATYTDNNGCAGQDTITINYSELFKINNPNDTTSVSCFGCIDGSFNFNVTGGWLPYTYLWNDPLGQQSPTAVGLAPNQWYTNIITDANNCILIDSVFVTSPVSACDITPSGLFVDNIIHNRVTFNWSQPEVSPSHYMIRYRPLGTNQWTVMTAGPVNNNPFNGTSRTRYFMEPETTYEWNIRARVLNEDGSTNCQSPWSASSQFTTLPACHNLENLSVSTEANWVTLNADAPSEEWGVWQSKAKMKEVGTNSFRYANGDSDGNINVLKGNFSPNTEYQWHTKAWCTGNVDESGNSDPQYHSGWGEFSSFTTEEICDKMPINLTTSSNGANTAITMSWDLPLSGTPDHYFLELNNDNTGQQWQWNNIAGNQTSKSKFGLTQGEYSWRIRGACGSSGTSWATIFSEPVYYTLGGARFDNDFVTDLNVYPNPSKDVFNISFSSEKPQSISIRVTNVIGEEIYNEELIDFDGNYTHELDMSMNSKGVYFLEISTEKGTLNSKMVLQ